jgi:hypothetical protein
MAARNACVWAPHGCICDSASRAGTWGAVILLRSVTLALTPIPSGIRSSGRSSRARTGAGVTSTRSMSDLHQVGRNQPDRCRRSGRLRGLQVGAPARCAGSSLATGCCWLTSSPGHAIIEAIWRRPPELTASRGDDGTGRPGRVGPLGDTTPEESGLVFNPARRPERGTYLSGGCGPLRADAKVNATCDQSSEDSR